MGEAVKKRELKLGILLTLARLALVSPTACGGGAGQCYKNVTV